MTTASEYAIHLTKRDDGLHLHVVNGSREPLRIWRLDNAWGWPTVSLEVRKASGGVSSTLTPPGARRWTVNFPAYVEIPAGDSVELFLSLYDGLWQGEGDIQGLLDATLLIRAVLAIPLSPEAAQHGVFVGRLVSDWLPVTSPHPWLRR